MKKLSLFLSLFIIIILSGCLYPNNKLTKNETPNEAQIESVQTAVNQYVEQTGGLVPIKTKPSDTPIFKKYIIDFDVLKNEHLLSELPGNAFEEGGYYQYSLINPEDDPTVKLIDIRIVQVIQAIERKLNSYQEKHTYLPLEEHIERDFYTINFKKLGYKTDQTVVSPFSQDQLPIIIDTTGQIYVDYRVDLYNVLQDESLTYSDGDDARYILVDQSPFVPIFSPVYTIVDGEPVFDTNE